MIALLTSLPKESNEGIIVILHRSNKKTSRIRSLSGFCQLPERSGLYCLLLANLLLATPVVASAATKSLDPSVAKRVDADVQAILNRTGTPGATIAIVDDGRVLYRKAYGFRDLENRFPATIDTYYEIGSITKQFTAAAILQLGEAGKLEIDDKLSKYLPDAPYANEVTLRQLLSHTSGLPEYLEGPNIDTEATQQTTFQQLMARIADKPLAFAPGSKMAYNNTGYILLGRVIEVVSKQSYRDYVRKQLLDRAGMKNTFTVMDESHLPNMAVGYRHAEGKLERAQPIDDSWGWSAGHLVSTIDDLQKWNAALTQRKVISAKSYALMTTPAAIVQGESDYGFGLFVDTMQDQPRIGHTGGSFGFTTANEFFPKQKVRVIAFTNQYIDPEPGEMITTAVFDDLFPSIAVAASKPAPGEDRDITARSRALFLQMQTGTAESSMLVPRLADKMKNGLSQRLAKTFAPFGTPERFIFKGSRLDGDLFWYDYVIDFGPGSQLKFAVALDSQKKVATISFG